MVDIKYRRITYINQFRIYFLVFLSLLNNYDSNTETAEKETDERVLEQNKFTDTCLDTPLMKEAHRFLVEQG